MQIRRAEKEDNPHLAKLIREVFREYSVDRPGTVYSDSSTDDLYNLFSKEGSALFLATENNEITGCCGIFPTELLPKGCAELVKFYIRKEHRGQGIGKKLMKACLIKAKELGYSSIYLESFPEFSEAISMYEKMGFKRLSKPMGNSGHFACTVWMSAEISELNPPS